MLKPPFRAFSEAPSPNSWAPTAKATTLKRTSPLVSPIFQFCDWLEMIPLLLISWNSSVWLGLRRFSCFPVDEASTVYEQPIFFVQTHNVKFGTEKKKKPRLLHFNIIYLEHFTHPSLFLQPPSCPSLLPGCCVSIVSPDQHIARVTSHGLLLSFFLHSMLHTLAQMRSRVLKDSTDWFTLNLWFWL